MIEHAPRPLEPGPASPPAGKVRHCRGVDRFTRAATRHGIDARLPGRHGLLVEPLVRSSRTSMFDSWAAAYDDSALQPAYAGAHRAVLNWAADLRVYPSRIVDVGCGTGQLLAEAARAFPEAQLFGVDPSAGMLSVAATRAPGRVRLVRADAERLPFPDGTFDLVTATYSLRHWTDSHVALHQIARILTPQGLVGLADAFPADRRRASGWRYRLGVARALPPAVIHSLSAARLRLVGVATVGGFGAITDTTIAVAARHGGRGAPGGRPVRWRRGLPG